MTNCPWKSERKIGSDSQLKILILKERLEALIRDKRYEDAKTLFEEIKNLEKKV